MAYKGQVVGVVLGTGGQSGSKNTALVSQDQLIIAENLTFEDDTLRKEGGAAKYNSTAVSGTPSIIGGYDWNYDGLTSRSVIATDAGALLRDDGAGDYTTTTLKSGLNIAATTLPVFVEGGAEVAGNNKKLFVFTGRNAVQVLDGNGATTSDLGTPPADWTGLNQPTFGLIHENRLWGGGNANDPHRLYYSLQTDHEDFTTSDAGSLSVYPGEGHRIVWAVSFRNLVIIAKAPKGIYVVDTTDPTIANWKIYRLTRGVGSPGPRAWAETDNDIVFMSADANIHSVRAIEQFGNVQSNSLTDASEYDTFLRDNLNLGGLNLCQGVYYAAKKEVHFGVTGSGSATNNRRVVVDLHKEGRPRFRFSPRDTAISLWLKEDSDNIDRLTMGDASGFVWDLDQATRSQDGSGYNATFQTPHLDFSSIDPRLGASNKNWDWLELLIEPKGNHDLSIDIFLDDRLHDTLSFNMGSTGADLGSFVLGTDALAGGNVLSRRKLLTGRSRNISLQGRSSGAAEDFSIIKFYFGFKLSDAEELI